VNKFHWILGAKKAIKYLNNKNYNIFVATNQSGIARGFYSEKKVIKLHKYIKDQLQLNDTYINQIYYCPFHKDGIIHKYRIKSSLRKPKKGMYLLIKKNWNIGEKKTFMIGDQDSDIKFAENAKIKGILFQGGNLFKFVKKYF
ncbi:HAD-IIIA family hydrolase, partial [Candidatus Pelagibacter ubique]|nr:HAD-IIIA family hydrolase [Candidatus Pelagibacter ubique]